MTAIRGWRLLPDPDERGVADGWFESIRPGARPAPVPGIIGQVFPEALGIAWYWATFDVDAPVPDGHRVLLRFGAVDYRCTVWVNGRSVGTHDNGETPFELDVTEAHGARGPSLLAVRVVAPGEQPADGIDLDHIPHRNKRSDGYHPGWLHAHGGILLPVELLVEPAIRIVDIHALPDAETGRVSIALRLDATIATETRCRLSVSIGPDHEGRSEDEREFDVDVPPGSSVHRVDLLVRHPCRWDLDDPFLYRVAASVTPLSGGGTADRHRRAVRCGFRELRITDGFFRLNGRRVLLRSSHTGNHFPVGQIVPPTRDLLRRDLINAKASGFNMIRFMSGVAWPEQLDLCDELGLMIYEEPMGSWLLKDSAEMTARYDLSLREMILRDRNHPCVTVWGLLTEQPDGRLFRHAVGRLGMVRELDPSRLVILNSGRFDAQPGIGSVSNPGGTTWEHVWGNEAPGAPGRTLEPDPKTGWLTAASWINGDMSLAGSIEGNGDTHAYPVVPHSPGAIAFLRGLGRDTMPHMLSEYGIGSLMNVIGETRDFESAAARPDLLDAALIRSMAERFEGDWQRYGMEDLYPFAEDLLLEAQRQHGRYRALGFDAVRSNPRIPGFNVTGLLDHALTGEGFWTFWRRWKPGIVDVLADGWAPLRWCLFASDTHLYAGRQLRLEAVLATEDALRPGRYPARFRLAGPSGIHWGEEHDVVIPEAELGDGPLAVPALEAAVTAPADRGLHVFAAELRSGGRPSGGRLRLRVASDPGHAPLGSNVDAVGLDDPVAGWLRAHGVRVDLLTADPSGGAPVIVIGGSMPDHAATWEAILHRIRAGAHAIVLAPWALRRGEDDLGWLPFEGGPRCDPFYDWVYHREWVRTRHPIFEGLPGPGLMDWDDYGPLLAPEMFQGMPACDDVAAAAFAVGYSTPGGYASGIVAGSWSVGAGRMLLNAFRVGPLIDRHPAADRMLLNMIGWARDGAARAGRP